MSPRLVSFHKSDVLMVRPLLPVLCVSLLLAGCGGPPPLRSTPDLTVTQDATLPVPNRSDLIAPDRASFIGPLDVVTVDVFGVPELTRDVPVDSGGRISLPLAGAFDVNGKTAGELSEEIAGRLRGRYVRDPQVNVLIRTSVSQNVVVDGSVESPGIVPVTNQTTLLRAIAASGGLDEFAKQDDVVILRTVNNRKYAGLYNLGQIRRGAYTDPPIYPNDVVIVGDSPARRRFRDLIQVAPLLSAPIVALIQ